MDGSPPPPLRIFPPLLNSANPWATTQEDLKTLFECSSTGAVTTRTSLLGGFPHDPAVHQYTFFDPSRHDFPTAAAADGEAATGTETETVIKTSHNYNASLNTLGYSPVPLDEYLGYISAISSSSSSSPPTQRKKYFIVSVTGTPDEVAECYRRVARLQAQLDATSSGSSSGGKTDTTTTSSTRLAVEVNLSCPNIPDHPPPAYSGEALAPYLAALRDASAAATVKGEDAAVLVPWGLKTPPYTYAAQFETLVRALRIAAGSGSESEAVEGGGRGRGYSPVSFLTATNTLGSCLVLDDTNNTPTPKLTGSSSSSTGIGGLAGALLHPLALGNVATLRRLLDAHDETRHVQIVGVGGVEDVAGYRRMRAVGAVAVGVGTALGRCGVKVFEEIEGGVGGDW